LEHGTLTRRRDNRESMIDGFALRFPRGAMTANHGANMSDNTNQDAAAVEAMEQAVMAEETATIPGMCKSILAAIRECRVPTLYHISQIPGCREFESRHEKDQKEIATLRARCEAAEANNHTLMHDVWDTIAAIGDALGLPPFDPIKDAGPLPECWKGKMSPKVRALREERDAAQAEVKKLRLVVRDCARTLQHNLSMRCIKDEQMMLRSLDAAWAAVGRGYCEAPLIEASP
jgi:hypothetical protein